MKLLFTLALSLSFLSLSSQILQDYALCKSIKDKQPYNETTKFESSERAYCWISVTQAKVGEAISVAWYHNQSLVYTSNLSIKYASMRTWTYKTLHKEGIWKAVIKTSNGKILKSIDFTVGTINHNKINHSEERESTTAERKEITKSLSHPPIKDVLPEATILKPENFNPNKKYPVVFSLPFTGGDGRNQMSRYISGMSTTDEELLKTAFHDYLRELYPNKAEREKHAFILVLTTGKGSTADHSWEGFTAAIDRYDVHIQNTLEKMSYADKSKLFLTGFSLGGDIGWALMNKYPTEFKGSILVGTRCGATKINNMDELRVNKARFYLGMGAQELPVRMNGMGYAISTLKKNDVTHKYYEIPNKSHSFLPDSEFKKALKYVFVE